MIIYKITNKVNGKVYIGQTIRPLEKRWEAHQYQKGCTYLHRAIQKYGADNFTVEQIDVARDREELDLKEQFWIQHYDCTVPSGYNLQSGGKHCEFSNETKEKIRLKLTGRRLSEETRKKIGAASRMRTPGRLGKPASESQKARARLSNPNRKTVICIETGQTYLSITQAANMTGAGRSHIAEVIRGKRQHAGGYTWKVVVT